MTRYYATRDVAVTGCPDGAGAPRLFRAGEELAGVPEKNLLPMIRAGHAEAREEADAPQATQTTQTPEIPETPEGRRPQKKKPKTR
jgi:hypothetical protein